MRLLWRPRTLFVFAYLAAAAWSGASPPSDNDDGKVHELGIALADVIPDSFGNEWTLVIAQAVPIILLAVALVVEERESGGTWMTIHRSGGMRRWWTANALAALVLVTLVVLTYTVLLLGAGLWRGWELTMALSEYARRPIADAGYDQIAGLSPLLQSIVIIPLRIATLTPLALFALTAGAIIRRPAVAYGLPLLVLLVYWRIIQLLVPAQVDFRLDLLRQGLWVQHGDAYAISWWYVPPVIGGWLLLALLLGRQIVQRVEVAHA